VSASASHSMPEPAFLEELLHTLSQPLTTLRCSLELSVEEPAEQSQRNVALALEQTERVVCLEKLVQEYLDCETSIHTGGETPLAGAVCRALDEISVLADSRRIRVYVSGTCRASISLSEDRLLATLKYLAGSLLEMQPIGSAIRFEYQDIGAESVLTVQAVPTIDVEFANARGAVASTLQRVRIAIAKRVLEAAGVSLEIENRDGVILRLRAPNGEQIIRGADENTDTCHESPPLQNYVDKIQH